MTESPAASDEDSEVSCSPTLAICQNYLEGRCSDVRCIYRHPPTPSNTKDSYITRRGRWAWHEGTDLPESRGAQSSSEQTRDVHSKIPAVPPPPAADRASMPTAPHRDACSAFLEGRCLDVKCNRRHFPSSAEELEAWREKFGGSLPCRWGVGCQQKRCKYYHPPDRLCHRQA